MGRAALKKYPITDRYLSQSSRATIKNIYDALVELITNADDSYKRLEAAGKSIDGEIEVTVKRERGGICKEFAVKDKAEGMDNNDLVNAMRIGGQTSGIEAENPVRGFFGRGLKEVCIALGEAEIIAVKGGKKYTLYMYPDGYDDSFLNTRLNTQEPNGTEVIVKVKKEQLKVPGRDTFIQQLQNHYALRDIIRRRIVFLIFEDGTRGIIRSVLKFEPPNGKEVVNKLVTLRRSREEIRLRIWETEEPLKDGRPFGLAGILIKIVGCPVDVYQYPNEPAALYFWGEATCDSILPKLKEWSETGDPGIFKVDRTGLDWRADFCVELKEVIEQELKPLVLRKKKEFAESFERDARPDYTNFLHKICNGLNELFKEEIEISTGPELGKEDAVIDALTLIPSRINLEVDKPRAISVYAPDYLINAAGDVVDISSDSPNLLIWPKKVTLQESSKHRGLYQNYFHIKAPDGATAGTIIAKLGEDTAFSHFKLAPPVNKKERPSKPVSRKRVLFSGIKFDNTENPLQRASYDSGNGILLIYEKFPGVDIIIKFLALPGEVGQFAKIMLADIICEAACFVLIRIGIENGKYYVDYGNGSASIDNFLYYYHELQKKYLKEIQRIILVSSFVK